MAPSGTERVTTAPAPTMARAPIVMPGSSTAPDRCPGHNDGIGKVLAILLAARELVVGEGDIRSNKYIVAHAQAVPQLHAALDGNAVPHDDVIFDQAV